MLEALTINNFLCSDHKIYFRQNIPNDNISNLTASIQANRYFYNNPNYLKTYFQSCHRDEKFKARWQAVTGSWNDKIIVDIGCGPGNLYATLGGSPKLLIGVDIAIGALEMARQIGYTPLLADAHSLPLISGFADLVTLNATLHHCDDMKQVLSEAARLVRPGGILVIDHDPQLSAWDYKGLTKVMYKIRLPIYQFFLRRLHIKTKERQAMIETETHHKPGDGVTSELFIETLEPLNFTVNIYPHNNNIGAEALEGNYGLPPHWRYQLGQRLSGINPKSSEAALSLLCVANRNE